MLLACVQSDVTYADTKSNLSRVRRWMEQASRIPVATGESTGVELDLSGREAPEQSVQSADLVVFPECMLTGYAFPSRDEAFDAALEVRDPLFESLGQAAGEHGQLLTIGFVEREGDRLFNSAALIGPNGVIGCYRKIHLPHLGVDRFVDRGDLPYGTLSATTPSGMSCEVGLAICYDGSFPEPMRVLGLCGADVIALGTNWPSEAITTPDIVPRARSMENHLFFVAANRVGVENGFSFCGRSSICGPDGFVLASSDDDQETLLHARVDLATARNKRIERAGSSHVIDRFADRCPEFYSKLVEGHDED